MKFANDRNKLVSSADIQKLGFRWSYVNDEWQKKLRQNNTQMLINTDLIGGPGVHWILVCSLGDGTIYCYDPLGPNNQRVSANLEPVEQFLSYIDVFFPYKSQKDNSVHCGYFSLYIADLFRTKKPFNAAQANAIIESEFGKSADDGDERRLGQADTTRFIY